MGPRLLTESDQSLHHAIEGWAYGSCPKKKFLALSISLPLIRHIGEGPSTDKSSKQGKSPRRRYGKAAHNRKEPYNHRDSDPGGHRACCSTCEREWTGQ